jgi:hypothetical protein
MRLVAVKIEARQAAALVFDTRDLATMQCTRLGSAIRRHLTEYVQVARKCTAHAKKLGLGRKCGG